MNTATSNSEADDPGALAVVGCLRAVSTILEAVSRLPRLFIQVEPILLPIIRRMLTRDGQGNYTNMPTEMCSFTHLVELLTISICYHIL